MTALLVVFMFVGFVALDVLIRSLARKRAAARERHLREEVLRTSIRLDVDHEAKSLKRAEVPAAQARILAVDDEPVVLDSFRKILVLAGYSVDTVESGPEVLGLVQRNDYDFVFTDLKMPGMDGVEVVKAVKHLRPDVDVAVITGYATIETAVETMQHGAVDYVQKPFTEDELTAFARRLLIKRQARVAAQQRPTVRVGPAALARSGAPQEYVIPGGAFISAGHGWVRIEESGRVRLGLDDFARKALGSVDAVMLPSPGQHFKRGDSLVTLRGGAREVHLRSPLRGIVSLVNEELRRVPAEVTTNPYGEGWMCVLDPQDLAGDLTALRIGQPAVEWYHAEVERLQRDAPAGKAALPVEDWEAFDRGYLAGGERSS
jgi:CheY-like chemotaxis protein